MGYPVITRLGINQFWYRHWYSDTSYFFNSKQDVILIHFLKNYLNYGIAFRNNVFFHEYFFNKKEKNTRLMPKPSHTKFYRKRFFASNTLSVEHTHNVRIRTGEYFPMRIWLLRYSNWLIMCFNCFKPIKAKANKRRSIIKKEIHSISPDLRPSHTKTLDFKRIKLVFIFFKKMSTQQVKYSF